MKLVSDQLLRLKISPCLYFYTQSLLFVMELIFSVIFTLYCYRSLSFCDWSSRILNTLFFIFEPFLPCKLCLILFLFNLKVQYLKRCWCLPISCFNWSATNPLEWCEEGSARKNDVPIILFSKIKIHVIHHHILFNIYS